ncbi:MAG: hypothetical protein LUH15_09365 [Tannerellaceae bacterium]|nr:hypothetical protein [Tannerellaceae bacterium]
MKKRNLLKVLLWIFILPLAFSCNDDDGSYTDVDGLPPVITLSVERIQGEVGRDSHIAGLITDADGLKSIRLVNEDMYLDKTIDLLAIYDELLASYELDYKFNVKEGEETDSYRVKVIATDVGDRTTEENLVVSMDGDFQAPVFSIKPDEEITVLLFGDGDFTVDVSFTVTDDKALEYVELSIPLLNVERNLSANRQKEFSYEETFIIPDVETEYELNILAADTFGLVTEIKSIVVATKEMPDFAKMYLVDVATAQEMNSDVMGIPMYIERTAPYTYVGRYYSEKVGTEVRFVPQKTDFKPICFGIDPADRNSLTWEPNVSLPIVLDEVAYYEFEINIRDNTYSYKTYIPEDEPIQGIGETGHYFWYNDPDGDTYEFHLALAANGLGDNVQWNTIDCLIIEQDPDNPFIFYKELDLVAGNDVAFCIIPWAPDGWWKDPAWKFDAETGEDYNVLGGSVDMGPKAVPATGKYMSKFDTHLLRTKIYPID